MVNKYGNFSDEQLLSLVKEDNMAAFEEIYNRYWAKLYAQAFKRLAVKETVEELLQDLFTKLWLNRAKITVESSLAAYLATSIKYLVLNQMEKEMVRQKYKAAVVKMEVSYSNSTEETVILNELENHLSTEINKLPPKCKSVFELSRYEQYSNKDIAQHLNISEKTVENQITKAIKLLRTGLKDSVISSLILLSLLA